MSGTDRVLNTINGFMVSLILVSTSAAFHTVKSNQSGSVKSVAVSEPAKRPAFVKALVIDDRISVLRREASLQSEALRRLRMGHLVFVIQGNDRGTFCRVAVSRRTRGWIHRSALAVPGRAGEDQRLMRLIETAHDGLDRISLCRILIEHFNRSPLAPRALLLMGEEAERAAESLSQRARKRIPESTSAASNASLRDYFLSDPGLDRYSRLHIVFEFNEATTDYVYDGRAYRELVKRYPNGQEAAIARRHLSATRDKTPGRN